MKKHRNSSETDESPPKRVRTGDWKTRLLKEMKDPKSIILQDDKIVVLEDKYPKAKYHYLVLSKENIRSIYYLKKTHGKLLQHMEEIGEQIAKKHDGYEFQFGYHAIPSCPRLHMHVISTDFNSPHMEGQRDWNTFTTPYFRYSTNVREDLEEFGKIEKLDSDLIDKFTAKELQCHKCSLKPKDMATLKEHLLTHLPNK